MPGAALVLFTCYACGLQSNACPDCVVTVRVDPETGMPPDVAVVGGRPIAVEPTEEAQARSTKEAVCDDCVRERNRRYPNLPAWPTADETHRRKHL